MGWTPVRLSSFRIVEEAALGKFLCLVMIEAIKAEPSGDGLASMAFAREGKKEHQDEDSAAGNRHEDPFHGTSVPCWTAIVMLPHLKLIVHEYCLATRLHDLLKIEILGVLLLVLSPV
ncbi:MAG: hypothetical protein AB9872_06995 [Solidesulfovibrio sp.]